MALISYFQTCSQSSWTFFTIFQYYLNYYKRFFKNKIRRKKTKKYMPHSKNTLFYIYEKQKKRVFWQTEWKKNVITKTFLESCKAFFRNKCIVKEQVKLVENIKIILNDSDITHTPKYFIANTVTNFEILEHNDNSSSY